MVRPLSLAYSTFRHLPRPLRRLIIRTISPRYVVGTVVVLQNTDGQLLLLRERHHDGWGLPGGLLKRREDILAGAVREVAEEVGIQRAPETLTTPRVNVDAEAHRLDVIFSCHVDGTSPQPQEPEVLDAQWFAPDQLPELFAPALDVLVTVGLVRFDERE